VPDEFLDKLIDCLLKEELGGQAPPDLLDAILARAFPRRSRVWAWAGGAVAAAAAVIIGIIILISGGKGGTAPVRGAGAVVLNGQAMDRGAAVVTEASPAVLKLGSYATVEVSPRTRLTVEGAEKRESISLRQGKVSCQVDSNVGTFAVRTAAGTVQAAGTKFGVRLIDEKGPAGAAVQRMVVEVKSGLVVADFAAAGGGREQIALAAGEEATLPPRDANSGAVTGTVTAKGDTWVEVDPDGPARSQRYTPRWVGGLPKEGGGLDKGVLAGISQVKVGQRVELKWTQDELKRVTDIKVLQAATRPGESGTVTGIVTGKGDTWLEVRSGGPEKADRYSVRRVSGAGGESDAEKELLSHFSRVRVGDGIELKWNQVDQRKRVVAIRVVSPATKPAK
jgi:ferric-dicitrate binding protein FerR (iron transport regulator)